MRTQKIISTALLTAIALSASITAIAEEAPGSYTGYVIYTGNVIADINGITQQTQGAVIIKPDGTSETIATLHDKSGSHIPRIKKGPSKDLPHIFSPRPVAVLILKKRVIIMNIDTFK